MRNQGLHIQSHWGQWGNEPPVVHAYDFLLMRRYIWKHNVIISLWPSRPIREGKGSVFQSHLSQSQQRCAELCCLNWFKQYSRDCRGVSLSSEVSQGPHVIFFLWPPKWKWEADLMFFSALWSEQLGITTQHASISYVDKHTQSLYHTLQIAFCAVWAHYWSICGHQPWLKLCPLLTFCRCHL